MSTDTPPEAAEQATEPDLTPEGRKRSMVAVTAVLTVWGAFFLGIFAIWVAGTPTQKPAARPASDGGAHPGTGGPAGPQIPKLPPPGATEEEPGHEGHGHAPGEHGKETKEQ